ncbi:MAG TPA: LacI family DNA-binding transcriptional regulator, partial [Gemmatimonadota bacterium]|nr:LacI family DNA-binding transcriptional regulator [Gemmatimonadota bacterium]
MTIRDVARESGFSVATVSRVLNNSGVVRTETRRRIEAVTERLRYTPNSAARTLITRKTHTLGVVLPDLYGEFFSEVIRGIDRTAQQNGYHLLLSSSHNHEDEIEAAVEAMHGRVDGLVVMSPGIGAKKVVAALPRTLRIVLLNCDVEGESLDAINLDNYGGSHAMVCHLQACGHRRIAMIRGEARNHDARERLRGYRDALRAGPGEWAEDLELPGNFSESSGYEAAQRVLTLSPRPTALFAANDSMAIGALSALREADLIIPGEMAVAGFDDIPMARYASPPLSSVHVPIDELGRRATRKLLDAVEGGP